MNEPTSTTRRVATNALVPVALTVLAFVLIWRSSVGPTLDELQWVMAGGLVSAAAMAWSVVAMIGALFGLQSRPGDTAVVIINAVNLLAWIAPFDGAF